MKQLNTYIEEAFIHKSNIKSLNKSKYTCKPKDRKELQAIISKRIEKEGNECDLNDIDVSDIKSFYGLFINSKFNGDISEWDVSNVENMCSMFKYCPALTNTSLNNILASLATTSYTGTVNKTLKYIGLDQTQATTCTTLSNWAALSAKGWTTGY